MRILALLFAFVTGCHALDSFFKPNDVVALIGGQDMVELNELGYFETLLQQAYPAEHLKVRSLAWEGDTVFEQRRDLNYPPLETQLDQIGATVVVAQFGRMESLAGREKVAEFAAAYDQLIERLGGSKRRWVLIAPVFPPAIGITAPNENQQTYQQAVENLGKKHPGLQVVRYLPHGALAKGSHLSRVQQRGLAELLLLSLGQREPRPPVLGVDDDQSPAPADSLLAGVREKNRLWFHYTRPQNWAFLAGDRTNQPSSRDHLDKNKRWFPAEMEQFVPLIEAQEKIVWDRAEKSAAK